MKAKLAFDGGARPTNPGHAGCGVVLIVGNRTQRVGRYIGWKTNNYAEYTGLLVGLKMAIEAGAEEIVIYTDSKLVQGQLQEGWKVKSPVLLPIYREVAALLAKHFRGSWEIQWGKRDDNKEADALCTAAILKGMTDRKKENPWVKKLGREVRSEGKIVDPFQQGGPTPPRRQPC